MKIKKAEILKLQIPLSNPFRVSFGTITKREIIFLKLYDQSGLIGYGESANLSLPIYEPEFNDSMILLLKNYLIPNILNKNISSINSLEKTYNSIRGNNFAKTALESGFWHLQSLKTNKSLRQLWGGKKTKIPVAISIGLGTNLKNSINRVIKYIETYQPKRAKLKIKPGIDVKLVSAIRKKYPNLPIFVDANSAYTLKDINIFKKLDKLNLLMIEQPLRFDDLIDHSILQKKIKTPICLDESINSYHSAKQAIQLKACKIINIKPQRVGGYWQAKKISQLATKYKIPVWCGGMIESGWGQLLNCNIATLKNFKYENDICLSKWYLADDILEKPIPEKNGVININEANKLFKINQKKLKKYTIEKIIVK